MFGTPRGKHRIGELLADARCDEGSRCPQPQLPIAGFFEHHPSEPAGEMGLPNEALEPVAGDAERSGLGLTRTRARASWVNIFRVT